MPEKVGCMLNIGGIFIYWIKIENTGDEEMLFNVKVDQ